MFNKLQFFIAVILSLICVVPCVAEETGFTQKDRERLVRLETTLNVFMEQVDKRITELREDMNKRFELIDRRFELIDKRFEDINKRFEDINKRFEDINKRFEDINKRFEDINKRFEDINKRFEDINRRFDELINFLWMLVSIFTALTVAVIGFAYWDRRTIIRKARDEAIETIEKEGRLVHVIQALRKLAEEDKKVAEILRTFRLM
jgi:chaperonin cofactor prefoldin